MAKQITTETVLAAINSGAFGMGNEDVKGTIDGDKIVLFDGVSDCGHIAIVDGRLDLSAVDLVVLASCFGKAEEWILSAIGESATEAMESKAEARATKTRVIDYQTSEELGEATQGLAAASAAAGVTGVVGAYKNSDGAWMHAPEGSWVPSEVRSVYVVSP